MKQNRGFTLIELLVVISIIGLLSSIVLLSVASAKVKAANTARTSKVIQWRNALELYRLDNGGYTYNTDADPFVFPYDPGPVLGSFQCAGQDTGNCISAGPGLTLPVNTDFNNAMANYISSSGGADIQISSNGQDGPQQGIQYRCFTPVSTTQCARYRIFWGIVGSSNSCAPGRIMTSGQNLLCVYDSDDIYN